MVMKRIPVTAVAMVFAVAAGVVTVPAGAAEPRNTLAQSPDSPRDAAPPRHRQPPSAGSKDSPSHDAQPDKAVPRQLPSWGRAPAPRSTGPGDDKSADSKSGDSDSKDHSRSDRADSDRAEVEAGRAAKAGPLKGAVKSAEPEDTPAQRRRSLDDLYAHLASIDSADSAAPLVIAIERLWLYTGSDTIDVLMERVLKAIGEQRLDTATKLSDAIVELAPRYAEGWNRRALVAYLRSDYAEALSSLHRALALEPHHFKALDGIAQIMRETGEKKAALDAYKKLLDVHPYWSGADEAVEELRREVEGQGI